MLKAYESRVNFDCIFLFPLFRLVSGNLGRWVCALTLRVYKVFPKTGWGLWLQEETLPWAHQCNKLHSTICIVLLSEFVSQNMWLQQEIWVQSLGWKDPLEKEMATHSSILAWEVAWTEEPGRLQYMGSQKSRTRLSD